MQSSFDQGRGQISLWRPELRDISRTVFASSGWQDRKKRKCPDRDSARSARRLISGNAQCRLGPRGSPIQFAKRGEGFDVEQLDASGLQPSGEIAGAVVGGKNKRTQRRHLTRIETAPKVGRFPFFFRGLKFSALDTSAQFLLEGSQDSVAPLCVLPVLLVITQPKGGVNANEHQNQFGRPATQRGKARSFFRCLAHCSTSNGFAML